MREEYRTLCSNLDSAFRASGRSGTADFHRLGAELVEVASGRAEPEPFIRSYVNFHPHPDTQQWVSETLQSMLIAVARALISLEACAGTSLPLYFDHWTEQGDLMVVVNTAA